MYMERIISLGKAEISSRNIIQSYLPLRNKGNEFDFEIIAGSVYGHLIQKAVPEKYKIENFESDCLSALEEKLDDPAFLTVIKSAYFDGESLFKVSAKFSLFRDAEKSSAGNKHMSRLFRNMLASHVSASASFSPPDDVNFLETELLELLNGKLEVCDPYFDEHSYLPFLSKYFLNDLKFLSSNPKYYLNNIGKMLRLYAFLYCSQLALNLGEWQSEPTSKPLYFILDTEKASSERTQVQAAFNRLKTRAEELFPVLSVVEYFNANEGHKFPLWMYYQAYENSSPEQKTEQNIALRNFIGRYREARKLAALELENLSGSELFRIIVQSAKDVFPKGTHQFTIKQNYFKSFKAAIASHFIQQRGRSGYVLTLNQDNLLLLTNLAIGNQNRLALKELLQEFQNRGIWFDKQSETPLIAFYERVGNVERMSDSGDAVYVTKTL